MVGFQTLAGADAAILGTDGNGVILVPDVTNPAKGTQYSFGNSWDHVRGGAYDAATHDVWFATQSGLLRYKADLKVFAQIAFGEAGIASNGTDSHAVLFDEGNTRGRIVYYGTDAGLFSASSP